MIIHGLVTLTDQDFLDEEADLAIIDDKHLSMREKDTSLRRRNHKRDISLKQFDYIYTNKIVKIKEENWVGEDDENTKREEC